MKKKAALETFVILLIIYEFVANLSTDMFIPSLVKIAREFGTTDNIASFTMAAWYFGAAVVQLMVGPLSDRYGRRSLYFLGGAIFIPASALCALAPSIEVLIIARFFQGAGVYGLVVNSYATIHEYYDDPHAIHILGWMETAAVLAPLVGPVLGGYFLLIGSWRGIFWLLAAAAIPLFVSLWPVMPESNVRPDPHAHRLKRAAATYLRILANRRFMLKACSYGLCHAGISAWIAGSPFIIIELLDIQPERFGLLQVPIFLSFFIGAKVMKSLIPALRPVAQGVGLGIALIAGFFLWIFSVFDPLGIADLIVLMSLYAFGFGVAAATLNRRTLQSSYQNWGAKTGMFWFFVMLMSALATFLLSIFFDNTERSLTKVVFLASLLAFIFHCFAHLKRRKRRKL